MIRRIFAFSPVSRRFGTRRSTSSRWRSQAFLRSIPRCRTRRSGWSNKEVRVRCDWAENNPHPEASGWAFEYNNVFYPDTDDTAMVLMALRLVRPNEQAKLAEVFERAFEWQMSFQCARRRLGGFRQGCHPALAGGHAFRRSQRDPRSDLQRPDRADSGIVRLHWLQPGPAVGAQGDPLSARDAGGRRLLVRALGSELHLWHLAGPARSAARSAKT